jgi:hypothetical protein
LRWKRKRKSGAGQGAQAAPGFAAHETAVAKTAIASAAQGELHRSPTQDFGPEGVIDHDGAGQNVMQQPPPFVEQAYEQDERGDQ